MSEIVIDPLISRGRVNQGGSPAESLPGDLPAVLGGEPAFPAGLPFMRPTLPAWDALADSISEIVETGMLTKGHYLDLFEERVAHYLGVKHAVAVSSCTAGLMLVYRCLGLEGEVLVPSFTFMATVHPLLWQGATPVFVDIDPRTWNLDPGQIEAHITRRTTAIVAVHVFGNPAAIEDLEAIARRYGLALIFDAAHGFGALHHGVPLGGYGNAEVFSTSPTKLLVTGEGGVVTTNDDDLAERVRIGREYGNDGTYDSVLPGMNARMQEFSAILGLRGLAMLELNVQRRNLLAACYRSHLAELPGIRFQEIRAYDRSSFKDFSVRIDADRFGVDRDALVVALKEEGISTRAYYVPPVHQQTTYVELVRRQQPHLPVTDEVAGDILSLPLYSHMATETVIKVCEALERIHRHADDVRARLAAG
ncbi:MAG: DegT/DnrJ/EryC1/StrS family aminotransferase [Chloroflexi bacterium]|nr:MAG: DegT/DnrJ/EryC1/StrS family aminotransferase [Chloroflexota bacterium]